MFPAIEQNISTYNSNEKDCLMFNNLLRIRFFFIQKLQDNLYGMSLKFENQKANIIGKLLGHYGVSVQNGYRLISLFFRLRQETFVNNHTDSSQEEEWQQPSYDCTRLEEPWIVFCNISPPRIVFHRFSKNERFTNHWC